MQVFCNADGIRFMLVILILVFSLFLSRSSSNGYFSSGCTPMMRLEYIFLASSIGSWSLNSRWKASYTLSAETGCSLIRFHSANYVQIDLQAFWILSRGWILLRAISSSFTLVCFGRPATLFRVAMKCVQNAVTVVLGAKASAARQPVKCGWIYTPNISSLVAISTMFGGSL